MSKQAALRRTSPGEDLFSVVDALFVINLRERTDRRREFAAQLTKLGLSFDHPKVKLFPAVRPHENGEFPNIGTRGAFMSHLGVLREAVEEGYAAIIVCEDDLDFSNEFCDRLSDFVRVCDQENADIIYGGYQEEPEGEPLASSPNYREVPASVSIVCCHFMLIRGRMIADLAGYLEKMLERPRGDPAGGPMHVDGAFSWFRANHPEFRTLAAVPPLGHQRSSRTDIHDLRWFDRAPLVRDIAQAMRRMR